MSTRSCAVRVTIFSTGGKSLTSFEFYALTLAARSYVLLIRDTLCEAAANCS